MVGDELEALGEARVDATDARGDLGAARLAGRERLLGLRRVRGPGQNRELVDAPGIASPSQRSRGKVAESPPATTSTDGLAQCCESRARAVRCTLSECSESVDALAAEDVRARAGIRVRALTENAMSEGREPNMPFIEGLRCPTLGHMSFSSAKKRDAFAEACREEACDG